eukprot:132290_1
MRKNRPCDMRSQPLFSIDSRSLVLFRICICLWTFRDLYRRLPNLEAWHTDDGVLQPHMTPHKSIIHQILFYRGTWNFQLILFIFHFITTCNLFIGYKTTISSFLHFIFTISIHERMYYVLDGGDRLFRHLCFWLIFLPTWHGNNYASIDAILIQNKRKRYLAMFIAKNNKQKKKSKKSKKNNNALQLRPINNTYSIIRSYSTAAILIQSMIIYPFIMLNRLNGPQQTWYWHKCTAVHNSMASYQMSKDWGIYLAGYPIFTFLMCRMTIIIETIVPILILIIPLDIIKIFILFMLYMMQILFNVFVRIENFGYSTSTSMVIFIPSSLWDLFEKLFTKIHVLNNIKLKIHSLMLRAARTFKMFENIGNPNAGKNDKIVEMEHSLLWDVPMISEHEKTNIDIINSSKDICLLQPIATKLNKYLSLFFLIYIFINNLGDVQLQLFPKPDGGNIGEILRIDQQWVMYGPDVSSYTSFDLLVGEIEINEGSNKYIKKIVLNDLLTSNWKEVTVFEGKDKYKRLFNPTYINPDMRWERLFVKVNKKTDMMDSILFWFCKHIKERDLMLRYQNHERKYDYGNYIKQEKIKVNKMIRAGWCKVHGEIIDLWKQNTSIALPQYRNEMIRCFHQITCR